MFKKILIGIILFGVVAVLLLQIDDELNPEVASFLEQAKPAESSDAYLYLLGIVAAEGEDPLVVGKQLFASMQQAEEQYNFSDESFEFEDYPKNKKLTLPEGELFCNHLLESGSCWQTVFENKPARDQALKTYVVLTQRYQTFISMTDYHTLSKPLVVEFFPPLNYLFKANRLIILDAVNRQDTSDKAQAILKHNIVALRHHLEIADNPISKIMFTAMISENLDALSLLTHLGRYRLNTNIALLSLDERDFSRAISREFMMHNDLYINLYKNPEIFAVVGQEKSGNVPGWLVQTLYKANMSINESHDFFNEAIARSRLEQSEFAAMNLAKDSSTRSKIDYIRNPMGSILNDVASPNFDSYIASLFDLNAKIAIFNQTMNKVELPSDLSYIQNPYYEKGGTAFYSEDGKRICLTGPLDDDKNQRCLRVKL
ncbi:MAG: hypothetical protein COA63_004415 [Methylophaga sp.]|nr:hypothetical protein [Methylophaga sp.]